jgi:hypothetical protein
MSQVTSNGSSDQGLRLVLRVPLDLNLLPEASQGHPLAEEPSNSRSGLARVDELLREKEEFVRNAFLFLQDDTYPATNKVGQALSRFKDKFRKRCASFRIFWQGDSDVFVRIDPNSARLRWEGPYIFRGYKDQETKRQAVLEDGKGKKWYRASNQIRRYYPRLDFTTKYLDQMKRIDAQVPTGREMSSVLWNRSTRRHRLSL